MEERCLPHVSAVILLPPNFIVDSLLRAQIGCCLLTTVVIVHLRERRHDKGLTDVQISTALLIQLVQPLCRSAEVVVVLAAHRPRRPRLTQTEDTGVPLVKLLLPLSE